METFFTAGGVFLMTVFTIKEASVWYYYSITSEDDLTSITKYRYVDQGKMSMTEDIVESYNIDEDGFDKYRSIYKIMKEHHLTFKRSNNIV